MSSWASMLKMSLGFSASKANEAPVNTVEIEKDWNLIDEDENVYEISNIFEESENKSDTAELPEEVIQEYFPKYSNSKFQRMYEQKLRNEKYPTHESSLRKRKIKNTRISRKACFTKLPEKKKLGFSNTKETTSNTQAVVATHTLSPSRSAHSKIQRSNRKMLQLNQPKPGF